MKVGGFLLLCVFFLCCPTKLFSRTIIITPEKGIVFLNQALKETLPGDTILLKKGVYNGKIYINQIKGKPEFPIVIRGEGINESIINGNSLPGLELEKYGCQIKDSKWIVLENLQFYDCWTDIIKIKYSNYISVKNCKAIGGKRFLFAEGFSSHHLLIENCHWEQDEKVWTHANGYTWDELHHGEYSYYNGSLYQGSSTGGVFVLRNNTIQNTFNAFRLSRI
jgi:hypothetical protein